MQSMALLSPSNTLGQRNQTDLHPGEKRQAGSIGNVSRESRRSGRTEVAIMGRSLFLGQFLQ